MNVTWNPDKYLEFGDLRTRPAADLLTRVPHKDPRQVVDLGCGPGNSTRVLKQRWPEAEVIGVDNSAEMLAKARRDVGEGIHWEEKAIEDWTPAALPDVIFSNAALHWVADHERLFARLAGMLAPGGVLAVQMPHRAGRQLYVEELHAVARDPRWVDRFTGFPWGNPSPAPHDYYRWLAPYAAAIDIWTVEYLQVLSGDDPIFEWTRGTAQPPFLQRLSESDAAAFADAYRLRLRAAYPAEADGRTLFPFLRLFIIAQACRELTVAESAVRARGQLERDAAAASPRSCRSQAFDFVNRCAVLHAKCG